MMTRFDAWFTRYRLLVLAILGSLTFHSGLLLSGTYRGTYDAFVHIFFADHYARSWWNPWEPRWYTGFTMVSYPPLTHQLTALLSKMFSLPVGFIIVMLVSTLVTTLGVYRFSRLWVDERPALYAALLVVFSSSVAETVHVFGQLPTMFVIGVMLNALPFVWRWVEDGNISDLFRGWALLMIAAAGHHVTTLFGMVFFSGPILATLLLRKFRSPHKDENHFEGEKFTPRQIWPLIRQRVARVAPAFFRCGVFGVGLIIILVVTVLPYWLWSRSDPITQITIPHASRDSFLENTAAGLMFFLIPWGVMLFILPYALYKGFGTTNWILASSLALMALLGTGGTTPIPAFMLKGAFYILTLDRFTFWASIIILPFAGQFLESLLHGRLGRWITARFGSFWRIGLAVGLLLSLVGFALFTANLTQYRKFQPGSVDMTPIVEFLAKDNHDNWRYLTLGFGDQLAWLSAQTTALNVEGNYHSARRLPELTSTPIERLDGAKFTSIPGLGSLQAFLTNPQRYNLKYTFANDAFYEPILYFSGWHKLGVLENDVQVWERADVPPLPAQIPVTVYPAWQRLMWGTLPVGSLFVATVVFFFTTAIVPRFNLSLQRTPIIKRIVRLRIIRFWLIDDDTHEVQFPSEDWQLWKRITRRLFPELKLNPRPRRVLYGVLLLIVLAGGVVVAWRVFRQKTVSPEAVILNYYDALDFKRFTDSYTYLATDLTQEEYLRWLSLQGGILASFAKLENLYTDVEPNADGSVTAYVTAEWLTSLGTYPVEETWQLIPQGGTWQLVLDIEPPEVPRETFVATSNVDFYLDLPLTTLDETALNRGVLDRSILSVSPVQVVYVPDVPIGFAPESYDAGRIEGRFEGLISVIGAVKNHASAPAHLTITAILRDKNLNRLAETNVMDGMMHQLWPQEITPFRVDFTGASATDILDIGVVDSVELIVRGVPTSHNLGRSLVMLNDHTLYNAGLQMVDIPRLLTTFTDIDGNPYWVDGTYLEQAIAPGKTLAYSLPTVPDDLQLMDLPVTITGPRLVDWDSTVPDVVVYGYSR
ncbi:hypothetical protein G4Y79_11500 [Phototrophicus methaneseepsis]|uniref:Transmembrane protein n=1 Tax=Phototrophicus methaneseepsis TaxID=2710758 RepID=A0A7S8IGM7_9CHLR|nr:hypothetical protein [Phototrophicus methaneseepsis]QPC84961.1 hypothetical protein G4Y79_11500 [Phototrophicus methaneseepsis]